MTSSHAIPCLIGDGRQYQQKKKLICHQTVVTIAELKRAIPCSRLQHNIAVRRVARPPVTDPGVQLSYRHARLAWRDHYAFAPFFFSSFFFVLFFSSKICRKHHVKQVGLGGMKFVR